MPISHRTEVRRLAALARTALGAYPVQVARLRLLSHFWNTTFRVTAPDGNQYVLRVHHLGQSSVEAVRSELLWLAALRADGLPVPDPVPNEEQRLVTVAEHLDVPEPRLCVLFRWIEGRFFYRGLTPSHLAQVGELMARLHHHAAQWPRPPGFTRHRVDNLEPMRHGPADHLDFAVAESVTQTVASVCSPEAGRMIAAAIPRIWATMSALGEGPDAFGLIHADLHHRNVLFGKKRTAHSAQRTAHSAQRSSSLSGLCALSGALCASNRIGAIDFDDCGYGHWLYDLAVPLKVLQDHPASAGFRQGLLTGYRRRRPLPEDQEAHLDTFIALRTVQDLLGMIQEREHPAFRDRWATATARGIDHLRAFTAGDFIRG